MMGIKTSYLLFIIILILVSCNTTTNRVDIDISNININKIEIKRYGKQLFSLDKENLKQELIKLQPEYRIFLDGDLDDTINLIRLEDYISDTMLINVSKDCEKKYPDLNEIETGLTKAIKHYKYYYPDSKVPDVYTYISGFDYEYKVQFVENNLLIALDMYLGKNYSRYKYIGVPDYIISKFNRKYIVRDCMYEIANSKIKYENIGNNLLDKIVNSGKLLWFVYAMLPDIPETFLLNYTNEQLKWAKENESIVWAFLIENKMLFSSEMQPVQKFILDSPFTSYFGEDSPPRLGWWIGWQIVNNFMDKNRNINLDDLMKNYDAQSVLNNSGYKPGR